VPEQNDCLFCKFVSGEIRPDLVYQDDAVTAFRDINPQAPVHVLLVPNEHIASLNDLRPQHDPLVGRLLRAAADIAAQEGVGQTGYRLLSNCGRDGGQVVPHLHFHLLGGREMGWPPG
jgi:histidine triad (HIT) family protein